MDFETIRVEREDNFAIIKVAREKALNALNTQVLNELTTAVLELELDDSVSMVVLTGSGDKAFVAGADISEMHEMSPLEAQDLSELGANLGEAMESSSKPYIAAVNGFALGGGCELALCCDFIFASEKARFGQPEVKLGVIPGFGGTQRLMRRVGIAKAKQLVFTGDIISAPEAKSIGLADEVVAPDELMDLVRKTAQKIGSVGPLAVAEAKRVMNIGQSTALETAIILEQRAFASLFSTSDQREGMSAFVEKRKAEFAGE